jgi:uncharacterized protein
VPQWPVNPLRLIFCPRTQIEINRFHPSANWPNGEIGVTGETGTIGATGITGTTGTTGVIIDPASSGGKDIMQQSLKADAVQLLVIQPTPFCNINCDYCYLPDRDNTARITRETFREILIKVFASCLVKDQLSIVWHAGEPLAMPLSYYESLFSVMDELSIPRWQVRHSIQTNGMLISDMWCKFFLEQQINVGLSIDGPAFLHDQHRKDRQGRGTHDRVMRGVEYLRKHLVDFHVIAVITSDSLDYADEIFDFFLGLGVHRIGFNVEEIEGEHETSSLGNIRAEERLRKFWTRLYSRQNESGGALQIREFERAYENIIRAPLTITTEESVQRSSQLAPLGIITADWLGNLSSFSPELLGLQSLQYHNFILGNIHDSDLTDLLERPTMKQIAHDIYQGVKLCEKSCQYFSFCGGGAPSNKYFENRSFVSTETMYCRTSIQMPLDVVLADLEHKLNIASVSRK